MFWDGIRLQIPMNTIETISFDRRKGLDVILGAEMHKQPIPPLKQVDNEEDDVKTENTKNILPFILDGINTAKEPTTIQMKSWMLKWGKELFKKEKFILNCKNRQEKEILTPYLKRGQYPAEYSKEEKRLFRQKAEHFTLLGDDICFKRRDHLIRAVFGFETASIKQIIQTEHAVAHIEVNKMMAFMAYIKGYVKECEAFSKHTTEAFLKDLNIKFIHGMPCNSKAQGQVERINQTIKRWPAEKLNETGEKSTMVPAIYIDPDMVLVEENTADTQWILEIASDLYEEFTETVTTTTTIITDEFEIDSKIRTDV
ncbi:hypothetical protein CWI38_0490p0010 [Hamiltosporidium tvaerminnensis]|uniref:Integrase catalytic domain-containing protein n=1 Tax=Hamiltosporidium tvaerminnensis TaxID=1176355 RepID=A0A4Q9LXY3_9MICR|nr:hypothetical protein CWI38_0490p0010 [Hamiltosporidium tvaerminnensis]